MRYIDTIITEHVPEGWTWAIYSKSSTLPARAVLVSHDHRRHIGRDGKTAQDALMAAVAAVKLGERE